MALTTASDVYDFLLLSFAREGRGTVFRTTVNSLIDGFVDSKGGVVDRALAREWVVQALKQLRIERRIRLLSGLGFARVSSADTEFAFLLIG
ncbi:MAG: hypothetical protein HY719_11670 [Planctomycetes bacterium]|nr:hypothetical protein [Planctomycetota bacterium]